MKKPYCYKPDCMECPYKDSCKNRDIPKMLEPCFRWYEPWDEGTTHIRPPTWNRYTC